MITEGNIRISVIPAWCIRTMRRHGINNSALVSESGLTKHLTLKDQAAIFVLTQRISPAIFGAMPMTYSEQELSQITILLDDSGFRKQVMDHIVSSFEDESCLGHTEPFEIEQVSESQILITVNTLPINNGDVLPLFHEHNMLRGLASLLCRHWSYDVMTKQPLWLPYVKLLAPAPRVS